MTNAKKKPGPKPKPLLTHLGHTPPAQRVERSYTREEKLRVVSYWLYALVPDESDNFANDRQRHVTRKEVSDRFLILESTISGWKKLFSSKGSRAAKPDPTAAYPEMEEPVLDRFRER